MYQYIWDVETGGILLTNAESKMSKEPRPVYSSELDLLGFNKYWKYPKDDSSPIMWAESNNYIYYGRTIAKTKGGSYYTQPEIIILEDPEPNNSELKFVDIDRMIKKNEELLETLVQETILFVYNTFRKYRRKIDIFYVAFSGGKDSVVALDIVQRALPHNSFSVLFGNTNMEFPDTYELIEKIKIDCEQKQIKFYDAESKLDPKTTWKLFGPPSTVNRWCCSVHKTSPQINLLRKVTGKNDFTGMAFTGVRSEESINRSNYERISYGKKHSGQLSCHTILDWNSAELYCYILSRNLHINKAYKKGSARVGCLVCPNSTGKHEYIKRTMYQEKVDSYLKIISETSGKTEYSINEMKEFIDHGYWRTRKSGRELNFGQDKFEIIPNSHPPVIKVYQSKLKWQSWAKTIGDITQLSLNEYSIMFSQKAYIIRIEENNNMITFTLINCENSRDDIKFQSLMRSVIIKSLYCVGCRECEAECKYGCISMEKGIVIGDNCQHCFKCHEVAGHCLRYASIKNKISEGRKMASLDRYFTFGIRDDWMESFIQHEGNTEFWTSDGDGKVANKKKDAFKNFASDAGLIAYNKNIDGDKYSKYIPTLLAQVVFKEGNSSDTTWALLLANLAYSPMFNWCINHLEFDSEYTPDRLSLMLADAMPNDTKGRGKRNVIDSLKIILAKTPLGTNQIFADCDCNVKVTSAGRETITLNSFKRIGWDNPDPLVILYSLYKFAESCGDYYQFTLSSLLNNTIERDGISPSKIFGLDKQALIPLLNGLSVNYPDYISVSFSLGLDTITLNENHSSSDILELF